MSLVNKVALITGASSGIGRGTAIEFAKRGSRLALVGRNQEKLRETRADCLSCGVKEEEVLLIQADLSSETETKRALEETINKFKRLDILVNSAGIIGSGTTESTPLELYDTIMNINLRSVFHLIQLSIPHLKESKGNIVNVSSVAGLRAFPGVMAYCLSKAGLDQLTRAAALELAPFQVRVNAVNPGVIVTELHKNSGMSQDNYANFLEHCKTTHALGRPGTVDEVTKSIAFLASDDSSFTTGVTLAIDGGRGQMCPR